MKFLLLGAIGSIAASIVCVLCLNFASHDDSVFAFTAVLTGVVLFALSTSGILRSLIGRLQKNMGRRPNLGEAIKPPRAFEFFLWLFAKPKERDGIIGDAAELFETNAHLYGLGSARWLYRWDVASSLAPLAYAWIKRLALGVALLRRL